MRSNFNKEQKQQIVKAYFQSGKSQTAFAPEDYLRSLFEKAPYAETDEDWEKFVMHF